MTTARWAKAQHTIKITSYSSGRVRYCVHKTGNNRPGDLKKKEKKHIYIYIYFLSLDNLVESDIKAVGEPLCAERVKCGIDRDSGV